MGENAADRIDSFSDTEPYCEVCGDPPSMEALEDGFWLCEEHDTPKNRQRLKAE